MFPSHLSLRVILRFNTYIAALETGTWNTTVGLASFDHCLWSSLGRACSSGFFNPFGLLNRFPSNDSPPWNPQSSPPSHAPSAWNTSSARCIRHCFHRTDRSAQRFADNKCIVFLLHIPMRGVYPTDHGTTGNEGLIMIVFTRNCKHTYELKRATIAAWIKKSAFRTVGQKSCLRAEIHK